MKFFASMFVILALFISTGAWAITITDTGSAAYWGGILRLSSNQRDVIGSSFFVDSLTATQSGGITTVTLSGAYFGTSYAAGAAPFGVGSIGDLYISTGGWKVNSPANNAKLDKFDANEGWNYVVSYADKKVYSLDFAGIAMTSWESGWWGGGYRSDQAYRGGYDSLVSSATVTLLGQTLTFTFPDLGLVDSLGFHWTMACGNDVVEGGGTPVPEPATMLLLGSGLIAVWGFRRKFKN